MMGAANCLILLTGGTGYIGGRLLSLLEESGRRVRCSTRRPEALQDRVGATTELVRADVLDRDSLSAALNIVWCSPECSEALPARRRCTLRKKRMSRSPQ